ncbi:hypothetical protein [Methylobacterium sp. Leaf85]|uniref:hypothetical protein n=1 Tax=Methylobacterium sp. Leaf85 TaxID=1736241 RepID=UPI00070111E5|nr:hypothetical protein [Methylobacterium sp. Leaf85]KQO41206.1 hypothetical protein ASF08_15585 [Methylobacterium sp. Leaf85]
MRPSRGLRLLPALLVLPLVALPAHEADAQNFFEELFGIGKAAKPPVPPRGVPPTGSPQPGTLLPPGASGEPAPETPKAAPAPLRPVVLKTPTDDNILGQELMLNGLTGSLKIDRAGGAATARITLPGTKVSQPNETCKVPLSGGSPISLSSEGRPQGVARYEIAGGECPLRFEILEGSVLVTPLGSNRVCSFTAADCATTPVGLWGPAAATLIPRSAEFDSGRGVADKAVRDNYKVMTQRARGQDVRTIVTEQAAFSSDREQTCRTYAREGAHGFCNVRFTEARALSLAARLGASTATPTASTTLRPRKPKPAVEGMNPDSDGSPIGE